MATLTSEEISFLQWLCENGGRCAVAGDIDFTFYRHVVDSSYVEVKPNRFSANTLYFTITKDGGQTLEASHGSNLASASADCRIGHGTHARNSVRPPNDGRRHRRLGALTATACRSGFRQLPLLPVRPHEGALSAALATNHAVRQRPDFHITGIARHVEHHFVPTRLIEARHQQPMNTKLAHVAEGHRRAMRLPFFH